MNDKNDNKINITVEGELKSNVESQSEPPKNLQQSKSGGNTPSGLDAIKKTQTPMSGSSSTSRGNISSPNIESGKSPRPSGTPSVSSQQNVGSRNIKSSKENKNGSNKISNPTLKRGKVANPNDLNPTLNQNKMKNFGRKNNRDVKDPKVNSSASLLGKAKGMFNGKNRVPRLPGVRGFGNSSSKTSSSTTRNVQNQTFGAINFVQWFMALPLFAKVAIVSGVFIVFLLFVVIVLIIANEAGAADGNRDLKSNYILGDYTNEELCEYLDRNGYLNAEDGTVLTCEDAPAYQFFVNFKELMEEYEEKYSTYRFQVNVELMYETLAYYYSDEEMYAKTTKDEIEKLIQAMIEEIEESCVIKSYNEKTKVCTQNKYVYTLYEFSLDKYVSYLKYGETSTHPNYGNDSSNKSSNGKAVTRICGEGKNVDYVFGFGLVNTSSSPLTESSDCPNNPVTKADYEENAKGITTIRTTLEKLGVLGGVEKYSHVNYTSETSEDKQGEENVTVPGSGTGSEIANYALQFVGNPYVYGGNSLTTGTDCSGFVNLVYAHFGYTVARQTSSLAKAGTEVACDTSSLQPGDLILYGTPVSHVAIYVGNGNIVHAKGSKWGITTDKYDYSSKGMNTCRRIIN